MKTQRDQLDRGNHSSQNRIFTVGDNVPVKNNTKLGNMLASLYTEQKIEAD